MIVGTESTGKTTLTQNLALAYNTNFVPEIGRETCDYAGGEEFMIAEDLYENLLRQKIAIMDAAKYSNRILFVDTDALTTLFYSNFLLRDKAEQESCTKLAEAVNAITDWDLVLFLEPTVSFVQDGTRNEEIAADREKYSKQIKDLFEKYQIKYYSLDGDYLDRFVQSKRWIRDVLKIDTKW